MISKSESQIYFAFFFKIMKDESKHVLEETLISLDKWLHHPFNYVQMNTFRSNLSQLLFQRTSTITKRVQSLSMRLIFSNINLKKEQIINSSGIVISLFLAGLINLKNVSPSCQRHKSWHIWLRFLEHVQPSSSRDKLESATTFAKSPGLRGPILT